MARNVVGSIPSGNGNEGLTTLMAGASAKQRASHLKVATCITEFKQQRSLYRLTCALSNAQRGSILARHYCVQTKSNCEFIAQRFLVQTLHFNVYLPRVRVERCHAGRRDTVIRPFFARYLFIEDDGRGPFYFRSAHGVSNVVKHGEVPVRLRQCVIDRVRDAEHEGFVRVGDGVSPEPEMLQRGDFVRWDRDGAGFDAVFHEHKNTRRAFIMVEMMGRAAKVEVALKDLERA